MEEVGWMYLDDFARVEEIGEKLPIDWVIERLFGRTPNRGQKIQCIAPQHPDTTPSLKLWSPSNPNILTRLHCYGCGLKGDVFDVIDMAYHSNGRTLEVAEQMLAEFESGQYNSMTPRMRDESAQLEFSFSWEEFQRIDTSDAMIHAFLIRKKLWGKLPMEYCRDEWRWIGSKRGQGCVAMPHFTRTDAITGVKLRSTLDLTNKYGFEWSQYPELYGSWRDKGQKLVVLTEGETDCVYAAFQLLNSPYDVFAIPTGVSQHPSPAMREQLTGRDLHIIFDADERGNEGRKHWMEELLGVANSITSHDLPLGHDICTYSGSILGLLRNEGG